MATIYNVPHNTLFCVDKLLFVEITMYILIFMTIFRSIRDTRSQSIVDGTHVETEHGTDKKRKLVEIEDELSR